MKHTIAVNGIKVYAFHGCLPEEGLVGGNYVVDVMLNTNFSIAAEEDDLTQTIDYVDINKIVYDNILPSSLAASMAASSKAACRTAGSRCITSLSASSRPSPPGTFPQP